MPRPTKKRKVDDVDLYVTSSKLSNESELLSPFSIKVDTLTGFSYRDSTGARWLLNPHNREKLNHI